MNEFLGVLAIALGVSAIWWRVGKLEGALRNGLFSKVNDLYEAMFGNRKNGELGLNERVARIEKVLRKSGLLKTRKDD